MPMNSRSFRAFPRDNECAGYGRYAVAHPVAPQRAGQAHHSGLAADADGDTKRRSREAVVQQGAAVERKRKHTVGAAVTGLQYRAVGRPDQRTAVAGLGRENFGPGQTGSGAACKPAGARATLR